MARTLGNWWVVAVAVVAAAGCGRNEPGPTRPAAQSVAQGVTQGAGARDAGGRATVQIAGPYATAPRDPAARPAAEPITRETPTIFVAWTGEVRQGDQLRGRLTARAGGAGAPPVVDVASAVHVAQQAGAQSGVLAFPKPVVGWPPAAYRVEVLDGERPMGALTFSVR